MIEREIKGDSGLTKLKIQIDGDEATVLFRVDRGGAIATFLDTFKTEDLIELGQSLTLHERGERGFVTHREKSIPVSGTCLSGHLWNVPYSKIVEVFGEPEKTGHDKTDVEWTILFDDGTTATIYNWKNGRAYCGEDGLEPEQITDWNVGGFHGTAASLMVEDFLN
tara:strand:+ start:1016 stop:1513 length:498 start_codon:yes stop_codon:yes gene_type:complete